MSQSSPDLVPVKYIDSLETRKHIGLFYEDPGYARLIEFRFLKNGLLNGETCVYATEDDSGLIVIKMLTYGIPLEYFQSRRMQVYQIRNSCGDREEIMKSCRRDLKMILGDLIPPFRLVSRIVPDVSTMEGILVELELEHEVHHKFHDFGGFLMCPYDISKIEYTKRKQWIKQLYASHHDIIYAPQFGMGGVFCHRS